MFAQLRLRSPSWSKFNHWNHCIHKYQFLCFAALPFSAKLRPRRSVHSAAWSLQTCQAGDLHVEFQVPIWMKLYLQSHQRFHTASGSVQNHQQGQRNCVSGSSTGRRHKKTNTAKPCLLSLLIFHCTGTDFLHIYSMCTLPPSLYLTTRYKNQLLRIIDQAVISNRSIYCETRVSINNTKSKINLNTNIQSFHCI